MIGRLLNVGEGKSLRLMSNLIAEINDFAPEIELLTDGELMAAFTSLRVRALDGESLDDLLPHSFALTRAAAERTLNMRPFDSQLQGAIVLHQGSIAEMRTGEGKTLTATLPAALNALAGEGVHVITVNDYLAERDARWMFPVYAALGLTVGIIQSQGDPKARKEAYNCDITYVTNSEAGFDYLRDNIASSADNRVQRGHSYAIVDEVDNILIDEARTPLIISGESKGDEKVYQKFAKLATTLIGHEYSQRAASGSLSQRLVDKTGVKPLATFDYEFDPKQKTVAVSEQGVYKSEQFLSVTHLYLAEHGSLVNHLHQALKAQSLYKKDVDYAVVGDSVAIIDEFTGRILEGRRWSEGLHQAIEAKEGVTIQEENQTIATITYQNFFRRYQKLSGMTGTAMTEAVEFKKIYGISVVEIPTNKPMIRTDKTDYIYKSEEGKWPAVIQEIKERNLRGQPVLVGTVSVEVSELLSGLLRKAKINHTVLNAKPEFASLEGSIIAEAGKIGKVTIATNMAGRGVDIKLGGDPEHEARVYLEKSGEVTEEGLAEIMPRFEESTSAEREEVLAAGGLMIIGTERHESRRIDNQLRGRSGRQGDPGESRFYISAQDELMRLFGGERLYRTLDRIGPSDDEGNELPIESGMISKQIEKAQRRVEEQNFLSRKRVLEYDDVLNQQRDIIYSYRNQLLDSENIEIVDKLVTTIEDVAEPLLPNGDYDFDKEAWTTALSEFDPLLLQTSDPETDESDVVLDQLAQNVRLVYQAKEDEVGEEIMRDAERVILLQIIDDEWKGHLDDMDYLRDGIHLRGFAQIEPIVAYKGEAFTLFEDMMGSIWRNFARYLFHLKIEYVQDQPINQISEPPINIKQDGKYNNVGRNQPCPCGSGKKFKLCHGR